MTLLAISEACTMTTYDRCEQIRWRLMAWPDQVRQALTQLDRFTEAFYAAVEAALLTLIVEDVPEIDLPVCEATPDGRTRLHFSWGDRGVTLVPCKHVVFPELDHRAELPATADCAAAGKLLAVAYPLARPDRRQVLCRFYVYPDGRWQQGGSKRAWPLEDAALEAGMVPFLRLVADRPTPVVIPPLAL